MSPIDLGRGIIRGVALLEEVFHLGWALRGCSLFLAAAWGSTGLHISCHDNGLTLWNSELTPIAAIEQWLRHCWSTRLGLSKGLAVVFASDKVKMVSTVNWWIINKLKWTVFTKFLKMAKVVRKAGCSMVLCTSQRVWHRFEAPFWLNNATKYGLFLPLY